MEELYNYINYIIISVNFYALFTFLRVSMKFIFLSSCPFHYFGGLLCCHLLPQDFGITAFSAWISPFPALWHTLIYPHILHSRSHASYTPAFPSQFYLFQYLYIFCFDTLQPDNSFPKLRIPTFPQRLSLPNTSTHSALIPSSRTFSSPDFDTDAPPFLIEFLPLNPICSLSMSYILHPTYTNPPPPPPYT